MRQNSGVVDDEFDEECWCSGVFDSVRFVLDDEVRLSIDALDFVFGDFFCDLCLTEPSRLGLRGGVGRGTLSQRTLCNGSTPPFCEWPTKVVVDIEFGIGESVCFLLNVERRASGLVFRGRSRSCCCC